MLIYLVSMEVAMDVATWYLHGRTARWKRKEQGVTLSDAVCNYLVMDLHVMAFAMNRYARDPSDHGQAISDRHRPGGQQGRRKGGSR